MTQLKAIVLNASLKKTKAEEPSHTEGLSREVLDILEKEGVETEIVRLADYHIPYGISGDLGGGDMWPQIFEKVKEADIVLFGTPLWLGEKSSLATVAMERLYGSSGETNEKGQSIFYNKVGGVIITGNEDGAKHAASSVLYGMSHIGFTVPPNVDAYWVGEAGPGPSYLEGDGQNNEFTKKHVEMLAYNTLHFARMLREHPIPAEGNKAE
ncbi:flavodoxin family protein [Halobacillus litoralis]|uniref:Flavodoxin family protein n=1 Tax=Halobacillus litoralis TaxID=45668 RepID=A0A845FAF7_9BACI|nr:MULTISPECIES: flavodoxin family protein [Halobacillus]MEC3883315.1 flavodoxin family protein [Halobacillus sp. HZG1]MYL70656.1 flavodoxin family protein [Halobacillus litoralis]